MSARPRVPRDARLYLEDILQACTKVVRFMEGTSQESFESAEHEVLHDAILRNLYIIGEAACHLPEKVTGLAPEVPWGDIRGFRNHLCHAYFNEDPDIVWDVVTTHVPILVGVARNLISRLDQASP